MNKEEWKQSFNLKYKRFTNDEKKDAYGWSGCAIGCRLEEESPEIHKMKDKIMNKLLTPKALRLGIKFYDYVRDDNVGKAEKTFNQIQELDNIIRVKCKRYYPWSKYF